ncbi:hypothetical protein PHYBOEH_002557 [Phytophthora boehmeriae]|uniref:M96 mating-specific protein family n=1 Tax=Phytophthora boehmeriae TaxID=109152 RepID=A0A8T1WWP4_9STRA|nr:hypothetical protein PHYBOEH_002557 [Phytophthora boehmeriae]
MAEDKHVDDAFLADLTAFLGDDDTSNTLKEELHTPAIASNDDKKLLSDHQLLSDVEGVNFVTPPPITENGPPSAANFENISQVANMSMTRREIQSAQASKRRNRYRQKLKDERTTLIRQESELSSTLRQLQSAQALRKRRPMDTMVLSVWRAIAKRQLEKRLEAEQQQRQLRAAVVSRARLIHQMKAFLQESKHDNPRAKFIESSGGSDGGAVIQNFVTELESLYVQVDQLFSELEFKTSVSLCLSYNLELRKEQDLEFFESTDATVIPYGFDQTAEALSSIMLSDLGGSRFVEGIPDPDNTTAVRYNISYRCGMNNNAILTCYTVTRRYVEAGRIVFVWRALVEGQDEFSGLHTDETGWVVVRPSTDSRDLDECPLTVIESYVRLVPISFGAGSNRKIAERFTKIVIETSKEEIKEVTRMLESILLESP